MCNISLMRSYWATSIIQLPHLQYIMGVIKPYVQKKNKQTKKNFFDQLTQWKQMDKLWPNM